MKAFTAHACFVGDHHVDRCFMLVLAERDVDDDGERLELRVLDGTDAEDRRMGLDVYSVTRQTGARHHNGIASWSIAGTTLTLLLKRKAGVVLDVDDGFVIELLPVSSQLEQVYEALARIVDG